MASKEKKRKNENEETIRRKKIANGILKGFIAGILLIMSTYAWFTTQKDITLSNLQGTVEVAENMEISLDAKTWHNEIDLSELVEGKTPLQAAVESRNSATSGTAPNIEPIELLPVSTVGEVGSSIMPLYNGTAKKKVSVSKLDEIKLCKEIENGKGIDNGYFAFDIYIKNSSRDDEPDTLQLNLNSSVQVLTKEIEKTISINGVTVQRTYEGNANSGIQNTVRVALALYEDTTGTLDMQKEVLDATKGSTVEKIAIWEPNAPYHVGRIVAENNNLTGPGAKKFEDGDELVTYALTSSAVGKTLANVYDTSSSILAPQTALQTGVKSTTEGAEDYRILSDNNKPINLIDTNGDNFTIEANQISRLRVYIWIEGQDVDCINLASEGGGIEIDLGLTKDDSIGDVLQENPDSE